MEELIERITPTPSLKSEYIPFHKLYRQPTYAEVINYVETEPNKIKFPNRQAIFT